MNCELCGKLKATSYCWYKYDNGDQVIAAVCFKCKQLHSQLTKGSKSNDD